MIFIYPCLYCSQKFSIPLAKTLELFFSRGCFVAILFFYQSNGTLTCPPGVSLEVFETECKFFKLPEIFVYRMKIRGGIIPNLDEGMRYPFFNVQRNVLVASEHSKS